MLRLVCIAIWVVHAYAKPHGPSVIPPENPDDPVYLHPGHSKSVLVIGGGLAGLSAALELAERGVRVVLKEVDEYVGGRVKARRTIPRHHGDSDEPGWFNGTVSVEHGFHAWFKNYYQMKDVRDRLGVSHLYRPWPAVHYRFRHYKPEVIHSEGPYPLNLLRIVRESPNLSVLDAVRSLGSIKELAFFDYTTVFNRLDNVTFEQWAKSVSILKRFYDIIFAPSLSVTLNERGTLSAAEMLTYQQLYFLSDPHASDREVATADYGTALLNPWVDRLRSLGAQVITNASVDALDVTLDQHSGELRAAGSVDVGGGHYDGVVIAADLKAVQRILKRTVEHTQKDTAASQAILSRLSALSDRVNALPIAPPYKVIRVWLDQPLNADRPDIMETPDWSPVNLVAQYHMLEDDASEWAKRTGGAVVEFHCYTWTRPDTRDEEVWGVIRPTVVMILPEVEERSIRVVGYHVESHHNFPSFSRGTNAARPNFDTPLQQANITNLAFAGDWLRPTYPSALMERAVSTGRQAANLLLKRFGVQQVPLVVPPTNGPGLPFGAGVDGGNTKGERGGRGTGGDEALIHA
ncbi:unnamed protein product [Vitrella brassicaformis CCMP3155]|uniref:Amine oxidase n=1 Tax=Vitrella brassicaformis (strain CCMP3155) TaxID=1169540 RepID=A0A0G4EGI4_VITBC|nr:unnamed protein product [Vitrella brassicaformis CCMP3155]|eukprot:CEL94580.1 unnamed protein product [Vitrella brassicaformis CCMP3155]